MAGLLHENDEVLEINGTDLRGKNVNDVCEFLAEMTGTLTFLIIPASHVSLCLSVSLCFLSVITKCLYCCLSSLCLSLRLAACLHYVYLSVLILFVHLYSVCLSSVFLFVSLQSFCLSLFTLSVCLAYLSSFRQAVYLLSGPSVSVSV